MKLLCAWMLFIITSAPIPWLTNFDTAKEMAVKENKFILLNFSGSDWCTPCIKMKKEVFDSEAFLSLAEKDLILIHADFPRLKRNQISKEQITKNEILAERYNPSGKFPLTLLLHADGNVVKKWEGYDFDSHDSFIQDLTHAIGAR